MEFCVQAQPSVYLRRRRKKSVLPKDSQFEIVEIVAIADFLDEASQLAKQNLLTKVNRRAFSQEAAAHSAYLYDQITG